MCTGHTAISLDIAISPSGQFRPQGEDRGSFRTRVPMRESAPSVAYLPSISDPLSPGWGNQQYSAGYVCIVARHALAFGRWCQRRGIEFAAVCDGDIERFQRSRARRR